MEENTVITLEDNREYLIVDKINLYGVDYYYLFATSKPLEIKIAVEKDNEVYFVEDKALLVEVFDHFCSHMNEKLGLAENG